MTPDLPAGGSTPPGARRYVVVPRQISLLHRPYLPEHLATRLALLRDNNLDIIQGGFEVLGKEWAVDFTDPSKLIRLDECVIGGTLFGKREVFSDLGGFQPDMQYAEDFDFWTRAQARYRVRTFPEPVTYRLHETPTSLRVDRLKEWDKEHSSD